MTFSEGDTVWYRDWQGNVSEGIVKQVLGDSVEVHWPDINKTMVMETDRLWARNPSWDYNQPCVCGCTFFAHSKSGCIPHQIHEFEPA